MGCLFHKKENNQHKILINTMVVFLATFCRPFWRLCRPLNVDFYRRFLRHFNNAFSATYWRLFGVEFNDVLAPLNGVQYTIYKHYCNVLVRYVGRLLHFYSML